ncbi:MAG: hypothetical protein A4E52_01167 [Pelotomaculum sp. PtaB.Bin013]|nr:MAG: hypothetical protein A4E52_01167 [Pelotomaculum sp. PtaB.Bin013]
MVNFQKIEKQLQMLNKFLDILSRLSNCEHRNHIISTHNFEAPKD